jgi:hypothetical protein
VLRGKLAREGDAGLLLALDDGRADGIDDLVAAFLLGVVADDLDDFSRVQLLLGDGVGAYQRLALACAQLTDGLRKQPVLGGEVDVLNGQVGAVLNEKGHADVSGGDHHGGGDGKVDEQRRLWRFIPAGARRQRKQHKKRPHKSRCPTLFFHHANHPTRYLSVIVSAACAAPKPSDIFYFILPVPVKDKTANEAHESGRTMGHAWENGMQSAAHTPIIKETPHNAHGALAAEFQPSTACKSP